MMYALNGRWQRVGFEVALCVMQSYQAESMKSAFAQVVVSSLFHHLLRAALSAGGVSAS